MVKVSDVNTKVQQLKIMYLVYSNKLIMLIVYLG